MALLGRFEQCYRSACIWILIYSSCPEREKKRRGERREERREKRRETKI